MKVVKISDAKNNLSRHLQYVRRGGVVRILDRDTVVADLVPPRSGEEAGDDSPLLDSLERRGLIRRGTGRVPDALLRAGPRAASPAGVVDALLAERRGSR